MNWNEACQYVLLRQYTCNRPWIRWEFKYFFYLQVYFCSMCQFSFNCSLNIICCSKVAICNQVTTIRYSHALSNFISTMGPLINHLNWFNIVFKIVLRGVRKLKSWYKKFGTPQKWLLLLLYFVCSQIWLDQCMDEQLVLH